MMYVTAYLNVISNRNIEDIMKEFKKLEEKTNQEEGCIYFHAHLIDKEKKKIVLWEIWKDEDSLNKHHKMPHTVFCASQKLTEVEWLLKSR